MIRKPTEEEIQEMLVMLEEKNPKSATRENAIKAIEGLQTMAGALVDRVGEDLESGKVVVSDEGEVTRND
ncbi:MAG: hypothetical protein GW762_05855 [Candidatus Pacebacteria bacterium]|nr:hypothetical protein [Candidatus Paceibacterota bacterium]PIR63216.1 MAG: hypothetical protein COU64_05870 [Candidatus Pacebacteria bacterium CG10_big_fil_rev_8_21_14_0_10_40_26]PIZ78246.1 MAG: hypothetical protein COY01_05690 [Candidatus Pacebacteria bacterium CG_4_10_14_0_2_um_filter_40_20]PJA68709.1 MAG: hypothetical protein CO156_04355 [Candidatus Pacebacteria bacterium CG_4_9_14_3_um_filter_40_12]PJC41649.1 MAG: hypothetical protein CO041_02945 [Candidatus Pacebacteria bacterium CG_4_9_